MNPAKTYFQDLALLSHVSLISVTYKGVAPCARLEGGGGDSGAGTCWDAYVMTRRH
jgi:hypothetical protein